MYAFYTFQSVSYCIVVFYDLHYVITKQKHNIEHKDS
jgi:hypothetical protein